MNDMLYCCTMTDRSESPEATPELISSLGYDFSSWKDAETKEVKHTLYFQDMNDAEDAEKTLRKMSAEWESFGVKLADIRIVPLKREDWAESWKIHFKTMVISDRLVIRPSWEKFEPKPGQAVIELDPGMSFGTGQHATTKFCLSALDRFARERASDIAAGKVTMLDAGSGSGILAIAACKLGYSGIDAFDIDPDTIDIARENARKNMIPDERIRITAASLEGFKADSRYEVVAANILSSALIAGRDKLLSLAAHGGRLILAGILDTEYGTVRKAFEDAGCREIFSAKESEWRGGAFIVP